MQDLVKHMVQALVDDPQMVTVNEITGGQTTVLEVRVSKQDLGKVIGKQGRMAKAMRVILDAVSAKYHKRAILEIVE